MDLHKLVNIFCLVAGLAVLLFAFLIKSGLTTLAPVEKTPVLFFLGAVIVVWALISMRRHR